MTHEDALALVKTGVKAVTSFGGCAWLADWQGLGILPDLHFLPGVFRSRAETATFSLEVSFSSPGAKPDGTARFAGMRRASLMIQKVHATYCGHETTFAGLERGKELSKTLSAANADLFRGKPGSLVSV